MLSRAQHSGAKCATFVRSGVGALARVGGGEVSARCEKITSCCRSLSGISAVQRPSWLYSDALIPYYLYAMNRTACLSERRQGENGFEGIFNHFALAVPGKSPTDFCQSPWACTGRIRASSLLEVSYYGKVLSGRGDIESSAFSIRAPIHRLNRKTKAVHHTHVPYASALTRLKDPRLRSIGQVEIGLMNDIAYVEHYPGPRRERRAELSLKVGDGGIGKAVTADPIERLLIQRRRARFSRVPVSGATLWMISPSSSRCTWCAFQEMAERPTLSAVDAHSGQSLACDRVPKVVHVDEVGKQCQLSSWTCRYDFLFFPIDCAL